MENNNYTITIVNDTVSGDKPQATASNQSDDGKQKDKTNLPKQLGGMAMLGYAKNIADRIVQSNINTVALRTGHEELQQRQQLTKNVANRAINIGASIAVGAKTGGAWGAVIGAVLSLGSSAMNIAVRQNEINIARQQENTIIFLNQIRIGAGGGRMGREL